MAAPGHRRRSQGSRRSGKRRSSGRSPGGQPGHEGHGRSLVSVEQVDELVPIKPSTCRRCGQALCGDDPHPLRHQEVVIPPVRAQVIEYQFHTLRCRHSCVAPDLRAQCAGLGRFAVGRLPLEQESSRCCPTPSACTCVRARSASWNKRYRRRSPSPSKPRGLSVRQQPTVNLDETGSGVSPHALAVGGDQSGVYGEPPFAASTRSGGQAMSCSATTAPRSSAPTAYRPT